jgi:predicted GH43/DUF377 family glycosyl hydrolase
MRMRLADVRTGIAVGLLVGFSFGAPSQVNKAWMLGPFARPSGAQPIITPRPSARFVDPILKTAVAWEPQHTFNPAAVVRDGKVFVLYRAEDDSGVAGIGEHTSRIGLAVSMDGVHFTQEPAPVFYPDNDAQKPREWPGGVEDPRIVEREDGTYVLTYTQWNRVTYSVGVATSSDLRHWTKWGPAFGSIGKYGALKYKSAGIVTQLVSGRLVAARVKGKYWMYWGEGEIRLATSADLIHWAPVEDASGQAVVLMQPRPDLFDSGLPEVGPPPVLTAQGIVLIYNGKNADGAYGSNVAEASPTLSRGTYSVGQALFAADDPAHLLERTSLPFFKPELPWEKSGQYAAGTTFAEGLVYYKGQWLLYYGCADSLVGVALGRRQK